MPRRTNEFQQLVTLIQRCLAPEGAIITESALIKDGKDEDREIDILMDTSAGPYRVRVAVEAKDEGRPMDITKFESILGKYFAKGGVPVDQVVVVTHRGFYGPVVNRAKLYGGDVVLLKLSEAKDLDWTQFRPPGPCFHSRITLENIVARSHPELPREALCDAKVACSCGRDYGSLHNFARHVFWNSAVRTNPSLLANCDEHAVATSLPQRAHVAASLPHDHEAFLIHEGIRAKIDGVEFDTVFTKQETREPNFRPNIHFRLEPHICGIEADPPLPIPLSRAIQKEARLVCVCCGKDHGSLIEWSHDIMFRRVLPNRPEFVSQFEEKMRSEPSGQAEMTLHWPLNKKWRIRHGDQDYSTETLLIKVHAAIGTGQLECKQFELKSVEGESHRVSHMEATVAGKRLQFLIPDGMKSKRIALRIDSAQQDKKSLKKKRDAALRAARRGKRKKN
jgi:hypothetical protein